MAGKKSKAKVLKAALPKATKKVVNDVVKEDLPAEDVPDIPKEDIPKEDIPKAGGTSRVRSLDNGKIGSVDNGKIGSLASVLAGAVKSVTATALEGNSSALSMLADPTTGDVDIKYKLDETDLALRFASKDMDDYTITDTFRNIQGKVNNLPSIIGGTLNIKITSFDGQPNTVDMTVDFTHVLTSKIEITFPTDLEYNAPIKFLSPTGSFIVVNNLKTADTLWFGISGSRFSSGNWGVGKVNLRNCTLRNGALYCNGYELVSENCDYSQAGSYSGDWCGINASGDCVFTETIDKMPPTERKIRLDNGSRIAFESDYNPQSLDDVDFSSTVISNGKQIRPIVETDTGGIVNSVTIESPDNSIGIATVGTSAADIKYQLTMANNVAIVSRQDILISDLAENIQARLNTLPAIIDGKLQVNIAGTNTQTSLAYTYDFSDVICDMLIFDGGKGQKIFSNTFGFTKINTDYMIVQNLNTDKIRIGQGIAGTSTGNVDAPTVYMTGCVLNSVEIYGVNLITEKNDLTANNGGYLFNLGLGAKVTVKEPIANLPVTTRYIQAKEASTVVFVEDWEPVDKSYITEGSTLIVNGKLILPTVDSATGTVKSVSLNGGTPIEPDDAGNVDISAVEYLKDSTYIECTQAEAQAEINKLPLIFEYVRMYITDAATSDQQDLDLYFDNRICTGNFELECPDTRPKINELYISNLTGQFKVGRYINAERVYAAGANTRVEFADMPPQYGAPILRGQEYGYYVKVDRSRVQINESNLPSPLTQKNACFAANYGGEIYINRLPAYTDNDPDNPFVLFQFSQMGAIHVRYEADIKASNWDDDGTGLLTCGGKQYLPEDDDVRAISINSGTLQKPDIQGHINLTVPTGGQVNTVELTAADDSINVASVGSSATAVKYQIKATNTATGTVKSVSVNNGTAVQPDGTGNVNLTVAQGGNVSSVSAEAQTGNSTALTITANPTGGDAKLNYKLDESTLTTSLSSTFATKTYADSTYATKAEANSKVASVSITAADTSIVVDTADGNTATTPKYTIKATNTATGTVKSISVNSGTAVQPNGDGLVSLTIPTGGKVDSVEITAADTSITVSDTGSSSTALKYQIKANETGTGTVKQVSINGGTAIDPNNNGLINIPNIATIQTSATTIECALNQAQNEINKLPQVLKNGVIFNCTYTDDMGANFDFGRRTGDVVINAISDDPDNPVFTGNVGLYNLIGRIQIKIYARQLIVDGGLDMFVDVDGASKFTSDFQNHTFNVQRATMKVKAGTKFMAGTGNDEYRNAVSCGQGGRIYFEDTDPDNLFDLTKGVGGITATDVSSLIYYACTPNGWGGWQRYAPAGTIYIGGKIWKQQQPVYALKNSIDGAVSTPDFQGILTLPAGNATAGRTVLVSDEMNADEVQGWMESECKDIQTDDVIVKPFYSATNKVIDFDLRAFDFRTDLQIHLCGNTAGADDYWLRIKIKTKAGQAVYVDCKTPKQKVAEISVSGAGNVMFSNIKLAGTGLDSVSAYLGATLTFQKGCDFSRTGGTKVDLIQATEGGHICVQDGATLPADTIQDTIVCLNDSSVMLPNGAIGKYVLATLTDGYVAMGSRQVSPIPVGVGVVQTISVDGGGIKYGADANGNVDIKDVALQTDIEVVKSGTINSMITDWIPKLPNIPSGGVTFNLTQNNDTINNTPIHLEHVANCPQLLINATGTVKFQGSTIWHGVSSSRLVLRSLLMSTQNFADLGEANEIYFQECSQIQRTYADDTFYFNGNQAVFDRYTFAVPDGQSNRITFEAQYMAHVSIVNPIFATNQMAYYDIRLKAYNGSTINVQCEDWQDRWTQEIETDGTGTVVINGQQIYPVPATTFSGGYPATPVPMSELQTALNNLPPVILDDITINVDTAGINVDTDYTLDLTKFVHNGAAINFNFNTAKKIKSLYCLNLASIIGITAGRFGSLKLAGGKIGTLYAGSISIDTLVEVNGFCTLNLRGSTLATTVDYQCVEGTINIRNGLPTTSTGKLIVSYGGTFVNGSGNPIPAGVTISKLCGIIIPF